MLIDPNLLLYAVDDGLTVYSADTDFARFSEIS